MVALHVMIDAPVKAWLRRAARERARPVTVGAVVRTILLAAYAGERMKGATWQPEAK